MPTVAINGLGRIGRVALKILLDSEGLEVAAVNDIAAADNLAYLLKYDSVYGRYHRQVSAEDGALVVDDRRIPVFGKRDPSALPWGDLGSTWCWSAPGCSPPRKIWAGTSAPVRPT
jgi:glyceraldehyde 3-phosphate dehydrogenase